MEKENYLKELLDQDSFYICMNCYKIYNENPLVCSEPNGEVHSKYVDMAKFLGGHPQLRSYSCHKSILRFDLGQIETLDFVTGMGNKALERILEEKGFETLGRVDNAGEGRRESKEEIEASWERVKKDALILASSLNARGEKYFVFSNSYMGGYAGYTFMKR